MRQPTSIIQRAAMLLIFAACLVFPAQAFYMAAPYSIEGGKMLVSVRIGNQTGRFVLDSGAPCSLTASFAARAGINGGQELRFTDSNGQLLTMRAVELPHLYLGGIDFMQLQAVVLEKGNIMEQMGADGIIGYNLMRQGIVKFDARRHLFILTDQRDSLGLDYNYCSELLADSYAPMLPVRIGAKVDTVLFDTGAARLYEMSKKSYARLAADTASVHLLAHGIGTLSAGAGGVEQMSEKWRLLIPSFHVGAAEFNRVTTITTDAQDSRIGMSLLHFGDVVLDFEEGFFYFLPHDKSQMPPDMYIPEWNVVLTVQNNHVVAGMVWDTEKSGIRSGDPIVAIGDRRIGEVDLREALTQDLFNLNPQGTTATYLDRRTGEEHQILLRME